MNRIKKFVVQFITLAIPAFVVLLISACSSLAEYHNDPKNVVAKYCAADLVGANAHTESWRRHIQPLTTWTDAPGWDYLIVVARYTVNEIRRSEEQSEVVVEYEIKGELDGHNFSPRNAMEKIVYKLTNNRDGWKINDPRPPPHVSINTALRLLEQSSIADEEHRTAIQNSISLLRKQMN